MPDTYAELDAKRKPIEWDGFNCIMLGTISEAGNIRRMDGCLVGLLRDYREADPKRLETFALQGQWLFNVWSTFDSRIPPVKN